MRETKRGNDDFVGLRLNERLEIASQATLRDGFQTHFESVQGLESEVVVLLVHLIGLGKGKRETSLFTRSTMVRRLSNITRSSLALPTCSNVF